MGVYTKAFLAAFKPKPILTISEWADRNRVLTTETSSVPGNWRTDFTPYLREPMDICASPDYKHIALMFASQLGKALDIDTPIATINGWKTQGTLSVGDYIFGADGKPTKVVALSPVWEGRTCYEVEFSDGSRIIADENHEWYVESDNRLHNYKYSKSGGSQGITTTKNISESFKYASGAGEKLKYRNNFAIPLSCPLDLPELALNIDPYVLGVWLGDGNSYSAQLTCHEDDFENLNTNFKLSGHYLSVREKIGNTLRIVIDPKDMNFCVRGHDKRVVGTYKSGACAECGRLWSLNNMRSSSKRGLKKKELPAKLEITSFNSILRVSGLIGNKNIPSEYLRSSFKQRLSLLQGLMDTDGYVSKKGLCQFVTTSEKIMSGFGELLSTLGIKYVMSKKTPTTIYNGTRVFGKLAYTFNFMTYSELPVFRLKRKLDRMVSVYGGVRYTETLRRRIVNVKKVPSVPVRCIQVDNNDHLYLAGSTMISTHNSEMINNVSGYYIDQEPSPQMMVQPTLQTAKEYSQIRIGPMIKASPSLSGKVIDEETTTRKKDKPNMFYKPYPGGYLVLAGSNSAPSLASKPIKILLRDEIDRFPDTIPGEGSPLELSEQRARTFYNRKIIDSSTPLEKGKSKIESIYEKSDKRHYLLPCPHCNHEQEITFKDSVKWDKEGTDLERSKTAKIVCLSCGETMKGSGRCDSEWLAKGRWVKTAESDIAGFYLSALYSPLITLQEIVEKWLDAIHSRDEEKKQTFYNLMLGLPYEKNSQAAAEYEHLYEKRREVYHADIPSQVCLLTAGVDVQDEYLVGEVVGWGSGWESWGIEYRVFMGSPDTPKVWQELDDWLLKKRMFIEGGEIPVSSTFIDSGGHFTTEVYKFTKLRESRRVFSIKGHAREHSPFISKPIKSGQVNANRFDIYVDAGKSKMWTRIHESSEGPGYCHFPINLEKGYDLEYFKGMMSEKYQIKSIGGGRKGEWVKIRKRNEPWDVRNYATAAAELIVRDVSELEKLNEMVNRSGVAEPKPATQKRKSPYLSKGVDI
nr:MAG: terminase large subunit [Caudoviricetes sp.]